MHSEHRDWCQMPQIHCVPCSGVSSRPDPPSARCTPGSGTSKAVPQTLERLTPHSPITPCFCFRSSLSGLATFRGSGPLLRSFHSLVSDCQGSDCRFSSTYLQEDVRCFLTLNFGKKEFLAENVFSSPSFLRVKTHLSEIINSKCLNPIYILRKHT